jgi:hypothetical protein
MARQNRGVKLMEGTIEKKIDTSDIVQLISVEKDKRNLFIANYSNSKETTEFNYDSTDKAIKLMSYRTIRSNIAGNVDSLSSVVMLDGIRFNKYEIKININDKFKMTMSIVTSFYKGLFLSMSYVYTDNTIGEEIELMLKNSKFEKPKKDSILSQSDLKKYILAETKPGGKLDYFSPIKGKEFDVVQIKPRLIAPMIEVALYKWGTACFELGLNTVDDAYAIFARYKGSKLNIRETTMIKDGFDKKNY